MQKALTMTNVQQQDARLIAMDVRGFKFRRVQPDRRNDGGIHREQARILLLDVCHRLLHSSRNTKRLPFQTSTS